ncbi:MAG: hypothetical protein ASARMPREDX12_007461 [Alectoria sarmentosa]|nr:MAG: hypothetical protein ASARMPREDX12_007461 [Alectoria sarmentosa]
MHKRFLSSIGRRPSHESEKAIPDGDSPEASVSRGVRLFCESGGPNNQGEEVLHLPVIVEAAESSPSAASEAALRIRKFLSKDNYQRAYVQYNAIMLVRILADNPGKGFTKNIDQKFVSTVKELLRDGRDMSVQQILRETLDTFEEQKANDETLALLTEMWKKEKGKMGKRLGSAVHIGEGRRGPGYQHALQQPVQQNMIAPRNPSNQNQQNYFARNHRPRGLPPPAELVQRVEEAKTSAKLLSQVVQSTPSNEVLGNELIKEFVERCQSATRSMQDYIHSDNPAPDEDTLLTLIETNDQLATAMSKHQRALLQARRTTGVSPLSTGPYEVPGAPVTSSNEPRNGHFTPPPGPPPGKQVPQAEDQNPFGDQHEAPQAPAAPPNFGLPPPNLPPEKQQPSFSRLGYQATSNYRNRQDASTNLVTTSEAGADDEVVEHQPTRQSVQYRF